jgi:hypothetical protein
MFAFLCLAIQPCSIVWHLVKAIFNTIRLLTPKKIIGDTIYIVLLGKIFSNFSFYPCPLALILRGRSAVFLKYLLSSYTLFH